MSDQQTVKDGNGNGDRDATGRFRPGHSQPGPGNPHSRQTKAVHDLLAAAMYAECTAGELGAIVAKLVAMAKGGNVQAMKLLFNTIAPLGIELGDDGEICISIRRVSEAAGDAPADGANGVGDAFARDERGV
jgi:hypothetical protein